MKRIVSNKTLIQRVQLVNELETGSSFSKELMRKIFTVLFYTPCNFKNRNNIKLFPDRQNAKYASLTTEEIFKTIYGEYTDSRKDKNRLTKLEKHLEALSSKYNSMYRENNSILEKQILKSGKTAYYYNVTYEKDKWNKLNYTFIPHVFDVNISPEDVFKEKGNLETKLMIAYLVCLLNTTERFNKRKSKKREMVIVDKHPVIFTLSQMEEVLKISRSQFYTIIKQMGLNPITAFSYVSRKQKRMANLHSRVIDMGLEFTDSDLTKATEFLKKYDIKLQTTNEKTLHVFRHWFYTGKTRLDKFFFSDSCKTGNYELITKYNEMERPKQLALYKQLIMTTGHQVINAEINFQYNHNKKHLEKKRCDKLEKNYNEEQQRILDNLKSSWSFNKDNETNVERSDMKLTKEECVKIVRDERKKMLFMNIRFQKNYVLWCDVVKELFQLYLTEYKTLKSVITLRNDILSLEGNKTIRDSFVENLKEHTDEDHLYRIFKSELFFDNFHEYIKLSDNELKVHYALTETSIQLKDKKKMNFNDEQKIRVSITNIYDKYLSDIRSFSEEQFTSEINEITKDIFINENIQSVMNSNLFYLNHIRNKYDDNIKNEEEANNITSHEVVAKELSENGFDSIFQINEYLKKCSNSFKHMKHHYEAMIYDPKTLLPNLQKIDNEILKSNLSLYEDMINEEKYQMTDSDVGVEIKEFIKSIGLKIGQTISIEKVETFILEVELGMLTFEDVKKELLL